MIHVLVEVPGRRWLWLGEKAQFAIVGDHNVEVGVNGYWPVIGLDLKFDVFDTVQCAQK